MYVCLSACLPACLFLSPSFSVSMPSLSNWNVYGFANMQNVFETGQKKERKKEGRKEELKTVETGHRFVAGG